MSDSPHTYRVEGMTCEHCVAALNGELAALPGVREVEVDLASGRLVVHGDSVAHAAVRAAVEHAGYSLAA